MHNYFYPSLQVLMDTSLGQLLKFWTEYALNEKVIIFIFEGKYLVVGNFINFIFYFTSIPYNANY